MDDLQSAKIQALAEPILAEREMELVELTCRPQGRQQVIRFLVDKVGGVTLQECAKVNQLLGQALDAVSLIEDSYMLEVSSPGLDRPLVTKRDFERALGEDLQVDLRTDDGRGSAVEGMLLAVQHEAVVLKTSSGNITVPFGQVKQGKKVVRW